THPTHRSFCGRASLWGHIYASLRVVYGQPEKSPLKNPNDSSFFAAPTPIIPSVHKGFTGLISTSTNVLAGPCGFTGPDLRAYPVACQTLLRSLQVVRSIHHRW